MEERRIKCFKAQNENMYVVLISNNYYIIIFEETFSNICN